MELPLYILENENGINTKYGILNINLSEGIFKLLKKTIEKSKRENFKSDFSRDVLEIVEIISKNSEINDKIVENTKKILSVYDKNILDKNFKSEYDYEAVCWDYIAMICLSGDDYKPLPGKEIEEELKGVTFDEKDYLKSSLFYFDWKTAPEDYIWGLETLIEANKINASLESIKYDKDKDVIPTLSPTVYQKLKSYGYILIYVDLGGDEYNACIVEKEDYDKIKSIIEGNKKLSEVIILRLGNEEW